MAYVTRNHPKLTLEGARAVLDAAERHAIEINTPMDIAVVDDGGHLLAFARMDGAKISSATIALVKAQAAATRRSATAPAKGGGTEINLPIALGLAIASPHRQIPIRGGLPLMVDGEIVGAIGVSNGSEDQDTDVAQAGVAALEKA